MRHLTPSIVRTVSMLVLLIAVAATAHAAGVCGNGILESSEECDPGGTLHVNGNPALATCTNGNDCFFAFSCCKFNCQYVGQGAPCADGNACTSGDHCDQVGQCIGAFVPDGTGCDDGTFCNGADTCHTGECTGHAGDPCAGNMNCVATCDEGGHQCTSTPNVPCADDGNACTDDVCNGSAVCTHPALPGGTICRAQATICDVEEQCPGGGAPCPADALVPNGTSCGDQCTTGGTCQNGQCAGGSPLVCDDADVCNGLETCDSLTGCVPGEPLDCDDGNACTSDTCAPVGGCGHADVPDGSPCDDAERCTVSDACSGGTCTGADVQMVALKKANFGTLTVGSGNIAVNDAKGSAKFSRAGFMTDGSLVTANTIALSKLASLDDVQTNKRQGPGIVRGSQTPVSVPLGLSCATAAATCGTTPVLVAERAVVRIGPGSYGDVKIGRRGTLELDPGEYDFCSVKTFPPAAFRPRGDVTVRIAKDLKTSRLAIFEPYLGVTHVLVGGKAKFGPESVVSRTSFDVPAGPFQLSRMSSFDGAVCAQKIKGQKLVHFGCPLP
jgi:hypothetical protein